MIAAAQHKHVTLSILWEEYIAAEPGGYRYSRFCELYRAWEGRLSMTMRQAHAAGNKLFVDYAGDGVPVVVDRLTGERRIAQVKIDVDDLLPQIDVRFEERPRLVPTGIVHKNIDRSACLVIGHGGVHALAVGDVDGVSMRLAASILIVLTV